MLERFCFPAIVRKSNNGCQAEPAVDTPLVLQLVQVAVRCIVFVNCLVGIPIYESPVRYFLIQYIHLVKQVNFIIFKT